MKKYYVAEVVDDCLPAGYIATSLEQLYADMPKLILRHLDRAENDEPAHIYEVEFDSDIDDEYFAKYSKKMMGYSGRFFLGEVELWNANRSASKSIVRIK